jgi:hypothetical protein
MRIALRNISGYPNLKSVVLPIVVKARYFYEGCYTVYAEEFRAYPINEHLTYANDGRGLSYSFYDSSKYKLLIKK